MKKLLLAFVITLFTFSFVTAQNTTDNDENEFNGFNQGDVILTGSVSFNSTSQGPIDSSGFSISPRVGFFVSEHIAVGPLLSYSTTKSENFIGFNGLPTNETKVNSYGLGAFGRYYFSPKHKFSIFTQLSLRYLSNKVENTVSNADFKSDGFNAAFAPGMTYFISDAFALEASLGVLSYTSINDDGPNSQSTDTFNFSLNVSNINLGLVYKF